MGQVTLTVSGRTYQVACDDGEEAHLRDLAEYVDSKATELAGDGGRRGDIRTLLLASLVIADELSDALKQVEKSGSGPASDDTTNSTDFLNLAAERLEKIAARVQAS